jgi:flagellar biosynthetic protein FlhB
MREERSRQRMMAAVPTATVVITNPTHYAVALKYVADEMEAPEVVAKGVDEVALRIKLAAQNNDVPVIENPPLARALYAELDLGDQIPTKYYEVVARVIRFVFGYDKTPPPVTDLPEGE